MIVEFHETDLRDIVKSRLVDYWNFDEKFDAEDFIDFCVGVIMEHLEYSRKPANVFGVVDDFYASAGGGLMEEAMEEGEGIEDAKSRLHEDEDCLIFESGNGKTYYLEWWGIFSD